MIFNVAICDDDVNSISQIKGILNAYEMAHNIDFNIAMYTKSEDLLANYTTKSKYHILFLDVEMPNINGLELAKRIRMLPDNDVKIVFVSNYPEYMKDSFNVNAFNYIAKPFSKEKCHNIIAQIVEEYGRTKAAKLVVRTDMVEELIYVSDIVRVETFDSKRKLIRIIMSDRAIECNGIISEVEEQLSKYNFISPSRGHIINIEHLHFLRPTSVIMDNGDEVALSRRKNDAFRTHINKNILLANKL